MMVVGGVFVSGAEVHGAGDDDELRGAAAALGVAVRAVAARGVVRAARPVDAQLHHLHPR
jgi:hypothetical protein